ncbi:D-alanyl-D-alanine carboxypeptidase family protein [Luteimicrobium sp. DT211]|uniref:M15 family metallopeptidase n=1 Tax=Luteimicrobium sp. DT211 TaxID=3393412 RepID=UPI003CEF96AF
METATSSPSLLTRRERREAALRAQAAPAVSAPSSPPVHVDASPALSSLASAGVARTSALAPRPATPVAPERTAADSAPYLTRRERRQLMAAPDPAPLQHADGATPDELAPNRGPGHANGWPAAPFTHHGPQVARVTAVEVTGSGRAVPASVPIPAVAAPSVVGPTCPDHAGEVAHEHPLQDAPPLEHDERPHVQTAELEALFLAPAAATTGDGAGRSDVRGPAAGPGGEPRAGGERSRWVPRVAVLTSLAVATIAVPLTGAATGDSSVDNGGRPEGPSLLDAVSASGTTTTKLPDSIRSLGDGAQRAQVASRSEGRDTLADCDPSVEPTGTNGQLPDSQLCELWQKGYYLANPAAVAITAMNDAFKARFGRNMCLVAAYRPIAEQYTLARTRAGYAAEPGTSNHGLGLAVDFCSSETGNAEIYQWLRANGPTYGWDNPTWARAGGGGSYEPWHFNYMPLTTKMGVL